MNEPESTKKLNNLRIFLLVFTVISFALLIIVAFIYPVASLSRLSLIFQGAAGLIAIITSIFSLKPEHHKLLNWFFIAIECYLAGLIFQLYAMGHP